MSLCVRRSPQCSTPVSASAVQHSCKSSISLICCWWALMRVGLGVWLWPVLELSLRV